MSLDHAILGFLNYQPFSGYDLKKAFDVSVQHFWPADQSQIYRTLGRLVEQGWTEVEVVSQDARPNRKLYHITPAGREELRRWLQAPLPHEKDRSAALVQVFFSGQLPDDQILPIFRRAAVELRERLEHYAQVPEAAAPYYTLAQSEREVFFWMLTLECGVAMARAQLEWIESVIRRFADKQVPEQ